MGAKNPEPAASKLTLKMRGQTSETPSKDEGPQYSVTVDNESLKRQQDLVRAGSASQDVDAPQISPRTRSLRRHVGSPKSSAATTPSASDKLHNVPAHGRDPTGPMEDENSFAHSQHAETRSSHGLHGSLLDSTSVIPSYDGKAIPLRIPCLAPVLTVCPLLAQFQQTHEPSPLDSLWRRPGQGWFLSIPSQNN